MSDAPRGMVLAAGRGERLWPLTHWRPKPLLPVLGTTLLDRAIASLDAAGCAEIAVNTHHLADQIAAHLAARGDHGRFFVSHEAEILGTGGALDGARGCLAAAVDILLHNGDVLADADLGALLAEHRAGGALATLLLTDWPGINSVRLGADGRVRDVAGRLAADAAPADQLLTYTGLAALSSEVLALVPAGVSDLVSALLAALRRDPGAVRGVLHTGAWADLGTLPRYLDAHAASLGADFVWIDPAARVDPGARLRASVVLAGADVPAGATFARTVIGPGWAVDEAQNLALSPRAVRDLGFGPTTRALAITGHGSDRRFWRLVDDDGRRAVVMRDAPGAEDLRRSLAISRFLHAEDLGAAAVLASDVDGGVLVSEDLGDDTLLRLGPRPERYEQALDLLAELQTRGTAAALVRCPEAHDRAFDHAYLRWETDYFRERFLAGHCGLDPACLARLTPEFDALADAALAQPQVIAHRDFQSQNILFHEGRVRLVDVQGMRLGPIAHDLAALLWDGYVDLDPALRDRLRDSHRERIARLGGPAPDLATWRAWCVTAALQRVMQALGAFGYLGHVKGRPWYLDQAPRAVDHLARLLAAAAGCAGSVGAPPPLPLLTDLVTRAVPASLERRP